MKYYAVKKGRKTGIFTDWTSCKEAVDAFPGAEYKSFKTEAEALLYLEGADPAMIRPSLPPGIYFDGGTGLSAVLDRPVAESNVTDEAGKPLLSQTLFFSVPEAYRFGFYIERDSYKTILFPQEDGFTNNFAELYAFYLALMSEPDDPASFLPIYGDSELILNKWSQGRIHVPDERTQLMAHQVMLLRQEFEYYGGQIMKISGDENPADLGFHK